MLNFEQLQLTNYLLFDEVEFTFKPGISHVFGKNRSGKSLLFSSLPSMLYDSEPVPKNARATLLCNDGNDNYDVTVFNNGKSKNRFELVINDRAQNTDTINAAKNLIDQHITTLIQQSIFETTVSLSGLREHPLITGKPSTRLDWVHETLAYASILDSYSDKIDQELKQAKELSIKYNLYLDEYRALGKIDKPVQNLKDLQSKFQKNKQRLTDIEYRLRQLEQILNTQVSNKPKYSVKQLISKQQKLDQQLQTLNKRRQRYLTYRAELESYQEKLGAYQAAKSAYQASCQRYDRSPIAPNSAVSKLTGILSDLEKKLVLAEENNRLYEEQASQRDLIAKTTNQFDNKESYLHRIEKLQEYIAINKRLKKAIDKGYQNCPVCNQSIKHHPNTQNLSKNLIKAQSRLKRLQKEYQVLQIKQTTDFVEYIDTVPIVEAIDQAKKLFLAAETCLNAKKQLPNKPQTIKYDQKQHKLIKQRLKVVQEQLIEAKAYEKSQQIFDTSDNPYLDRDKATNQQHLDKLTKQQRLLSKQQTELNEAIIQYNTQIALWQRWKEQREVLVNKAKPLRRANQDYQVLQVLKKAFGRDGFRTQRLQATLELFVDNLNNLAPLVWDEPFKFDIEIGARKCNLIIHRNKQVGDAFKLSGSERRHWQLLSALAMVRLLPSNRRCNTLILDELEANMDSTSRYKMMHDLLPEVAKTVPNIVVVSPLTQKELHLQPDHAYVVEKRNARSKLFEQ